MVRVLRKLMLRRKFLGLIARCKDEFFVKEFVDYYLREGVDHIYIIDDNSEDKSIYDDVKRYSDVTILFGKDIIRKNSVNVLYRKIRRYFDWIIYVDIDEIILPKKDGVRSLRGVIKEDCDRFDCIKIPWVMMSSGGRRRNPKSVLRHNVWRWDHDKRHPHPVHKFRCRYDQIEVKCIFRTDKFRSLWDHHPKEPVGMPVVVNSVDYAHDELSAFYEGLRERKIQEAHLVCYHYRSISRENNEKKINLNQWYNEYDLEQVESADYAELFDNTLSVRLFDKKIFVIGFNRVATRSIHYFFMKNGFRCVHWDNENLAKQMLKNRMEGRRLLESGRVVNLSVNSDAEYSDCQVFSDMTWHERDIDAKDFYKELDRDYPGSKFILNVRDVDSWIESRRNHLGGYIFETLKKFHGVSSEELVEIWRKMWVDTVSEIRAYFAGRQDFLLFNIDEDGGGKIAEFLADDAIVNSAYYGHVREKLNRTGLSEADCD